MCIYISYCILCVCIYIYTYSARRVEVPFPTTSHCFPSTIMKNQNSHTPLYKILTVVIETKGVAG